MAFLYAPNPEVHRCHGLSRDPLALPKSDTASCEKTIPESYSVANFACGLRSECEKGDVHLILCRPIRQILNQDKVCE